MNCSKRILGIKESIYGSLSKSFKLSLLSTTLIMPMAAFANLEDSDQAVKYAENILKEAKNAADDAHKAEQETKQMHDAVSILSSVVTSNMNTVNALKSDIEKAETKIEKTAKQAKDDAARISEDLKKSNTILAKEQEVYGNILDEDKKIQKIYQDFSNELPKLVTKIELKKLEDYFLDLEQGYDAWGNEVCEQITGIKTALAEVEKQEKANEAQEKSSEKRITQLENQAKTEGVIASDVNDLKEKLNKEAEKIAANKKDNDKKVADLNNKVDTLDKGLKNQVAQKEATDKNVSDLITDVSKLKSKLHEVTDKTKSNTDAVVKNNIDSNNLKNRLDDLDKKDTDTKVVSLIKKVNGLQDKIDKEATTTKKNTDDIAANKKDNDNKATNLNNKVDTLSKDLKDQIAKNINDKKDTNSSVNDLKTKVDGLQDKINKEANTAKKNKDDIAANKKDNDKKVASLNNKVDTLDKGLKNQVSQKEATDKNVSDLITDVSKLKSKLHEVTDKTKSNTDAVVKNNIDSNNLKNRLDDLDKKDTDTKVVSLIKKVDGLQDKINKEATTTKKNTDDIAANKKDNDKKATNLNNKVDTLSKDLKDQIAKNTNDKKDTNNSVNNLKTKVDGLQDKINKEATTTKTNTDDIAANKKDINSQVKAFKQEIAKKSNTDTVNQLALKVTGLQKQVAKLENALKDQKQHNNVDENNISKHTKTDQAIQQSVTDLSNKVKALQAELNSAIQVANKDDQAKSYKQTEHDELDSLRVSDRLMHDTVARISSKNIDSANYAVGINSGEIAENLEIWSSAAYQAINEDATESEDYEKITAKVFSLGVDTMLHNKILLGLSYGHAEADVKVYGNPVGVEKGKDDIKTSSVTAYVATVNNILNASAALMYANNKHHSEDSTSSQIAKYDSNVLELEIDLSRSFALGKNNFTRKKSLNSELIFGATANIAGMRTGSHVNKSGTQTDTRHNNFVTLGLGVAYNELLELSSNMLLDYKLGFSYNHVVFSGDKQQYVTALPNNPGSSITIKQRDPSINNFIFDLAFELTLNQKINLNLQGSYNIGDDVKSYGGVVGLRYHF